MRSELDDLLAEVNDCFDAKGAKTNAFTQPTAGYQTRGDPAPKQTVTTNYKPNKDYNVDEILNSPDKYSLNENKTQKNTSSPIKTGDDLLDDLLNETTKLTQDFKQIQIQTNSYKPQTSQTSSSMYSDSYSGSTGNSETPQKCYTPYVGPSSKATSFTKPCLKLRCRTCDFVVVRFDGARWDESADYYFFRNYIGNQAELNKKLLKDPRCAAYACQCSSRNYEDVEDVSKVKELKWGCAGH